MFWWIWAPVIIQPAKPKGPVLNKALEKHQDQPAEAPVVCRPHTALRQGSRWILRWLRRHRCKGMQSGVIKKCPTGLDAPCLHSQGELGGGGKGQPEKENVHWSHSGYQKGPLKTRLSPSLELISDPTRTTLRIRNFTHSALFLVSGYSTHFKAHAHSVHYMYFHKIRHWVKTAWEIFLHALWWSTRKKNYI